MCYGDDGRENRAQKSMSTKYQTDDEGVRRHLNELRDTLLHLHKALVDSERIFYEKTVGQILSPNHFLQLLASDPWFVWLHPLSELIVAIDEAMDAKVPPPTFELDALVSQAYRLLVPSESADHSSNSGFARHYFEALQRDPDVVVAHAEVAKLRRAHKAKG
jgi:hypothetical protein